MHANTALASVYAVAVLCWHVAEAVMSDSALNSNNNERIKDISYHKRGMNCNNNYIKQTAAVIFSTVIRIYV